MKNGIGTIRADRAWEQGGQLCWESRGYQNCLSKDRVTLTPPAGSVPASASRSVAAPSEIGIELVGLEMSWYVSRSALQKETIIHPQVTFGVRNTSNRDHRNVTIKCTYLHPGNVVFDTATEYLRGLRAGYTSQTVFCRPAMGYVDHGMGPRGVKNDLRVEISAEDQGKETLITSTDFSPASVR